MMSARRIWAKKALDLGKIYAFDVLKRLRAAAVKTPILILSVKAEPDDRVKGLGFGANDYLTKPFDRGELISRIKNLVPRKQGPGASRTFQGATLTLAASRDLGHSGRLNLIRTDMLEFLSLW
jgi:two-component system cell cycle response regulator CtrA